MSALDHLRAIGRGKAPADNGLLGNARCGWGRGELIGEEAILAGFCARPFKEVEATGIETKQAAGLIGKQDALIADIYDGRVGRLWRIGKGITLPLEPAIDVAFDPDMRQQRGDVLFRADDHPQLSTTGATRVLHEAQAHLDQLSRAGALRSRAFVVRAFGDEEAAAALLAVHTLGNETSRTAGFGYAILYADLQSDNARIVSDQTRPRPWGPRF